MVGQIITTTVVKKENCTHRQDIRTWSTNARVFLLEWSSIDSDTDRLRTRRDQSRSQAGHQIQILPHQTLGQHFATLFFSVFHRSGLVRWLRRCAPRGRGGLVANRRLSLLLHLLLLVIESHDEPVIARERGRR